MTAIIVERGPLWGRTPASQERRRSILMAGKHLFFEHGYQLASIDRIAEAAGTTKRTVYDHFGSKEALFAEVIAFGCRQFVELLPAPEDLPIAPAEGLRAFVERLGQLLARPEIIRFQRLIIAEAERHPEFSRVLHETALLGAEQRLADYLSACVADGRLPAQDTDQAARIVLDLTVGGARLRSLMAIDKAAPEAENSAAMDLAVAVIERRRP
jgi:AcrR family transcriptional regulator